MVVNYELEHSCNNDPSCNNDDNNFVDSSHRMSYHSFMRNNWSQIAESAMPLKASKIASLSNQQHYQRQQQQQALFQASVELRSRDISRRLIVVNSISLLVNLSLALIAFYFSFVNNSPSTCAFAADCILDFISGAIVLWRYHGDLQSVYMQAREQIACIYLGALFEISALGIIVKATSDLVSGSDLADLKTGSQAAGYDLVYLAAAATLACSILTAFKYALYKTIRDNSILLDVINTLISTVFAVSIIMSQVLINVNPSFWYMDPVLSVLLALFMAAYGFKVIHQNFHILKPVSYSASQQRHYQRINSCNNNANGNNNNHKPQLNYGTNLNASVDHGRAQDWQKSGYSSISFV